jgi:hypothetical protein
MSREKYAHGMSVALALGCAAITILAGCTEREPFPYVGNVPPETSLEWEMLDTADGHRAIHATWSGTDPDGVVDHFEVVTVTGLTMKDLGALDYDALDWHKTRGVESTFVLQGGEANDEAAKAADGQTIEAILVRAVDDAGAEALVPAGAFQIGETGLPRVKIVAPEPRPFDPLIVCYRLYLEWEGWNPEGPDEDLSYKYLIMPEADLVGGTWVRGAPGPRAPLPPLDFEGGENHWCPPIGMWSHWVPADCTYVLDIDLSEYATPPESVLVFVTVRNDAGAVLDEVFYRCYNNDRNWVRCRPIMTCLGVKVVIDEQMLGRRESSRPSEYENELAYIYEGTEVYFRFWADEDRPAGRLAQAYRYYYDYPTSPESMWPFWSAVLPYRRVGFDPEWIVGFPPSGSPFTPTVGEHEFVLEIKDLVGITSDCKFRLAVLEGPGSQSERLIYLVDDAWGAWIEPPWQGYEAADDSLWADILAGYAYVTHDTGPQYNDAVSPMALGQASTVIWSVDQDLEVPDTYLLRVCCELNNYLRSYVKTGGNLIMIGRDPIYAHAYWHDLTPSPDHRPTFTSFDFSPRVDPYDMTSIYNFNWEAFGIVEMEVPAPPTEFSTLYPCETGWDAIETDPAACPAPYWDGTFENGFFITDVRSDIPVQTLYGVVPLDANGDPTAPDCTRWLVAYVPSDGVRGHAAYIGVPPLLCNHDQIRTMILHLLDLFGEEPATR